MKKVTKIGTLALLSLIFTYCGSGNKGKQEVDKETLEEFVEKEFNYPIPTSFEVTEMLKNAEATYTSEIVNPPASADNYVTEWKKALNLGVYGADLSYASSFDKRQETIDFLNVSRKLIEELNISTAFNSGLADRIDANLDNKDSLILIVTESFYDTYTYLNNLGEEKTSLLVVAGSVIEGLYITTELIKSTKLDENLMKVLAAQKSQVKKLTSLLEKYQEDENVGKVLPSLRYISLFYDQLGEDGVISEGQFNDVSASINEIRTEITS